MATTVLLLDACSVLNFYASRQLTSILSLPYDFAVAQKVIEEASYVYRGGNGEDAREKEDVDVRSLVNDGLLQIVRCETIEETSLYVNLATELDDGEAMSCAIAISRGFSIVTDDGKAIGLMNRQLPPVPCTSTLAIIKEWAETFNIPPTTLRTALADIQVRANYFPARKHPLKAWWNSSC